MVIAIAKPFAMAERTLELLVSFTVVLALALAVFQQETLIASRNLARAIALTILMTDHLSRT